MELKDKSKNRRAISKKEIAFICIFSICFVFNFFLFNQLDVMIHNQAEFGISIGESVWPFFLFSFIIILVVGSILMVLCYFYKKAFLYTVATLIGLVLAGYAQVLFLNDDEMMNINGHLMVSKPLGEVIFIIGLNTLIYLAIVFIPIFILIIEKKKLSPKNSNETLLEKSKFKSVEKFTPKLAFAFAIIIFGMQLVGVLSVLPTAPKPAKGNELYYFNLEKQLQLSQTENIVVFLTDRLDMSYVNTIFERDRSNQTPDKTKDIFSGFTLFTDNLSQYPGTFPSVASLLTEKPFNKHNKQIAYMKDAWENPELFAALRRQGWKINGLLDTVSTMYDFKDLENNNFFDNIDKVKKKDRRVKHFTFFEAMFRYSMLRQSPYLLKGLFISSGKKYLDTSSYCISIKNTDGYFPRSLGPNSDLKIYEKLKADGSGLTAPETKKVFSFVHLHAAHNPFGYNENLKSSNKTNAISQAQGTFKILDTYFKRMKELDIFDKSTVIILADHGRWVGSKNIDKIVEPPVSALFVKEKTNDGTNKLEIDKDNPLKPTPQLSHTNFVPTILDLIGEGSRKKAGSYFDVINGNTAFAEIKSAGVQDRKFYYVRWTNMNSCKYFWTYNVIGSASRTESWTKSS